MRLMQFIQRALKLALIQLKRKRVSKYVLVDSGLQPAACVNIEPSNKTAAFLSSGAGAHAVTIGAWCAISGIPKCQAVPPSPRLGGLAQPWRPAPGSPAPRLHKPSQRSHFFGTQHDVVQQTWGRLIKGRVVPETQQVCARKFSALKLLATGYSHP